MHLGTIPDYAQEGIKGVLLSGVTPDSPAAQAGLKEKDVIVAFGPTKIENLYDYVYALQSAKAGEQTTVRIRRGERELELKIIPQLK